MDNRQKVKELCEKYLSLYEKFHKENAAKLIPVEAELEAALTNVTFYSVLEENSLG